MPYSGTHVFGTGFLVKLGDDDYGHYYLVNRVGNGCARYVFSTGGLGIYRTISLIFSIFFSLSVPTVSCFE